MDYNNQYQFTTPLPPLPLVPPPPPPIPQQQQQQSKSGKAAMAFAMFTQPFGIGTSRPPSSSGTAGAPTSAPSKTTARLASRTTELSLEQCVQAFSANQQCDRLVVAGRDFLKIINVGHDSLTESPQLLRAQSSNKRAFIQNEVKWGNSPARDLIATAATNGSIALYRDFRHDRTLQEHLRQVNRLAFNPADGRLLLSASQDGNVKLWDLRERKSRSTFQGKSEAVRDVQFNAANAVEFAAAYENGSIQRWDYRNPNLCERKISNAHPGPVYSVAWHPDGKHCASGGRDKTVKVWDFYADPRRKSKHTIYTQTSLGRVVWRPGGVRTTELATCSIGNDYRIHLWDLKRPYMPTYVLTEHGNAITGLQFRDEEVLWSAGKDGMVVMHDVCFGHMPIGDLPMVAFAWNSENEFTFATQRRRRQKTGGSGVRVHLDDDYHIRSGGSSVAEERSKKKESRSSSFRRDLKPTQQNSALDALLEKFQPTQATARVNLQVFNFDKFDFLARYYVTTLLDERKMTIGKACERNARVAMHVGEYRTAKTWQILGYLLTREDEKTAVQAEQERLRKAQEAAYAAALAGSSGGGAIVARRLLGLGGGQFVYPGATPLSRPVPDTPKPTPTPTPVQMEHMINIDEALLLPPAAFGGIGSARSGSVPSSTASTDGDSSPRILADEDEDVEGGGFVDSGDRYEGEGGDDDLGNGRETATSPRPILSLDTSGGQRQQYRRHNQNSRYNSLYRRDSSSGELPSFESSGAFFSTSGEESTSLERERRAMDNPPSTGSYEQPVFRTRPRQYSIGLMSEQTSGSYEERMMGLGSEREDNGDDGARMSLHAIQEEGHNGNNSSSGNHIGNYDGITSNVNNNNSNNNNSAFTSRNASQSYLPHPPPYPYVHHSASKNNSTTHLDTTVGSHTTSTMPPPPSWYRPPAPPPTSSVPRLELNNQPHPIPLSSCTPRPGPHQRLPYPPPLQQLPPTHQQQPQVTPEEEPPWSIAQLIPELTDYYTSQGDVQFLATLVNLLNGRYPLPRRQTDEWVETYVQLLHRKSQLKVAAEIVKWTPSGLVKAKGQTETFVSVSCGWCGRAILGGVGADTSSKGFTWCEGCKRNQDGCVICRKRVRGRWVACGICGHGGHEDCLKKWFFGDRVGRERDGDDDDDENDEDDEDDGEMGDKEGVVNSGGVDEDGSSGSAGGVGGGTRRVGKNKRRRRRRGGATAADEDGDEDEENEDELEMDICAAVGCAHECLPRNFS